MAENDDEFELLFEENGADEANAVDQLREFSAGDFPATGDNGI